VGSYAHSMLGGLSNFTNPVALAIVVGATLIGIVVGATPGLGGIVLLVILLPFLYNMNPVLGLGLMLASHSAIYYAGSTTAILINTPGAPESAATCIDGYAMTARGMAARALGISAVATTFGGWFGAIAILAAIPVMLSLVDLFHPPEYFFLSLLAVVIIGQLQSRSPTKALLSGLFGFLLSFIGAAASTGTLRFTFGNLGLYDGLNTGAVAIGLFALSQMFILFGTPPPSAAGQRFRLNRAAWAQVAAGAKDVLPRWWLTVRSAAIGVLCGVIPGIGSTAANFLSYGQAMRTSKHPERFGTGIPEGVIAPEASSISKEAGALIPTVALGIPNGPAMAVLLAAFSILGLVPGPDMLTTHLDLVFWMVWVLAASSLLASAVGLGFAPLLARVTTVPGRVLMPFVLVLAAIGAYASTSDLTQVLVMVLMGIVGLAMKRYGYSLPAVIVGVVLGGTAENNLILTTKIFGWAFLERPITDLLIAAIVAVVVAGVISRRRARRAGPSSEPAAAPMPSPGEIVMDACWVAGSAAYTAIAIGYPAPANIAPALLGGACLAFGLLQLVGAFVPSLRRTTHGRETEGLPTPAPRREDGGLPSDQPARQAPGPAKADMARNPSALSRRWANRSSPEWLREGRAAPLLAVLLGLALLGGIVLFGYLVAVPAFIFLYFVFVHRWRWPAVLTATAVMALITFVASHLLSVVFPHGLLLPL
jgi:putative tricarboxylic transport membrane protein